MKLSEVTSVGGRRRSQAMDGFSCQGNGNRWWRKAGQDPPECGCAAFVTVQEGELDVLNFPPIDLNDCTEETVCSTGCIEEWDRITNGGDLHTLMPDDMSVGQHMCDRLAEVGHTNYNNRKFVRRMLNEDSKERRVDDSREMAQLITTSIPNVLESLVTCYENWIFCYDPETKY
ncbi:hypothetical protein Pcinc_028833 [Petrolisthes cinctipes]|uniref:Uncharacterized protein n=1 Tax=Petrolisthes cinctipes TaxID=88211 RepID=A0AAE1K6L5_PETCI|nr:hypothetical protein Pcinc_028833 [Petrolisthes cinctipes]